MAKVIFENLTPRQAEVLAAWFDGQGEQDCAVWFDAQEVKAPLTSYTEHLDNGDVIVHCKTP